ncbi:amidohydrolase [Frankia sp. AgB1.9]|uniref:amidohydrolase family protein n=1 Tax=unclassified Frankia TaxID=2632575 RepID=UPI001933BEBB|nr:MULTISPECIES: amidohydrolase [unclassified Frankia]MBL7494280.1 amidohydrolase [Frankia sp. AgW1.1]MBL7552501.1 amidohydrolase [Frankia sp. AgB1.9]MBL7625266.1 amidohydrolase [Frankia sp. AgB1.8]
MSDVIGQAPGPAGEFLVRGAFVLTMAGLPDPSGRDRAPGVRLDGVVADGAVHVRDGAIAAVGPFVELATARPGVPVHGDGTGVVLPGLVSTHTHLSEALATGMGSELSLFEWGAEIVGPLGTVLTRADAAEGTALRAVEMLLSGVTTVNDMFCHANIGSRASLGVVDGLVRAGLRGVVSYGAEDRMAPGAGDPERAAEIIEDVVAEQRELAAAAAGAPLLEFRYGIGTLLGQSDPLLERGVALCREHGWAVHTHLAEVREEVTMSRLRWGHRTIEHAHRLGYLERPLIAGHCVWLTEADIALLAAHGVAVAHNPVANMILGSGVCPVPRLRAAGLAVGIGTDGAASNDSQDMLQAVKAAALLQKVHHQDALVIDALDVLTMATIDGARALGLDHLVGSLEPGKRADLVLLQDTVDIAVLHDPIGQVVYGASPRSVRDVWVDGRQVVADHACVTVDERAQIARCRPLAARLAAAAGLVAAGHATAPPARTR